MGLFSWLRKEQVAVSWKQSNEWCVSTKPCKVIGYIWKYKLLEGVREFVRPV